MKNVIIIYLLVTTAFFSIRCTSKADNASGKEFIWENATVYFLLTDRFSNGDTLNDLNFGRTAETKPTRGFMGGDIKGIIQKLEENYFTNLGIDAIWLTPVVEQIHGAVDEGHGNTYGYHGYWAKDWTAFEPNFGSEEDFKKLVETAHAKGIRIVLDVVINQTGPVTSIDPVWPDEWVRTSPQCSYQDYESTITCTLVENLPDIKTESNEEVEVPLFLKEKWKAEGRLESEMASLDSFFSKTGYPRTPRYYFIKWLTDFIRKYGIDGFRIDTVKHVEESVWQALNTEALKAFEEWKEANPTKVLDNTEFYIVGEVYGYNIQSANNYFFSDTVVNYFDYGFNSLINFSFKGDAHRSYNELFTVYSNYLKCMDGNWVMNYISSHDDWHSFDKERKNPIVAGTKLMLTPGAVQVYYGDETARKLIVEGEEGDANLRSFMNWDELESNLERNGYKIQDVLMHWQKLGRFRQAHPAVGAGIHTTISSKPLIFLREYSSASLQDKVLVGLDLNKGEKTLPINGVFAEGSMLTDHYSGMEVQVIDDKVKINTVFDIVLLSIK
ncbi:MAG: alpha-amylase [Bacteroidota bacterium]|nr:MAG: alpha-amylase [Bacteroidota bacterium]